MGNDETRRLVDFAVSIEGAAQDEFSKKRYAGRFRTVSLKRQRCLCRCLR